jgi:hypothetical protein
VITPDNIPVWIAIPASLTFMVMWLVIEFRAAPLDVDPEYSRLDVLDGLDTRTD